MSAIGAIFSLRGKPIETEDLIALKVGMNLHGKNGSHHCLTDHCGLTQQLYVFKSTPISESLPYFDTANQIYLATHVRLFNRKELQTILKLSTNTSDTRLIISAYLTWGVHFPSYLVGEFSIALWDEKLQRFMIAVDHFNTRPLYYFLNQDFLIVSSVMSALHHSIQVPRTLNFNMIARHDFKRLMLEPGETCFENIRFLPPAHVLIANNTGIKLQSYWEPRLGERLSFQSENEFQEIFESHFSEAVRSTLDTDFPVCLQLSGGLDSSAIACMANQILNSQNHPLICLSNYLPDNQRAGLQDEREYIHLIQGKHLLKEAVIDEHRGPFDDLTLCQQQLRYSPQHYQHCAINAAARRHQSALILHGTLAELTTSYSGYELLPTLFFQLRWITLIQELFAYYKIYNPSLMTLPRLIFHPRLKSILLKGHHRNSRQNILSSSFINQSFMFSQLTPELLIAIKNEFLNPMMMPSIDARQNALKQLKHHLRHSSTLFLQMEDQNEPAVYFSNPYFDKRLVEFTLNVPNEYRFKKGYPRSMIRIGMKKYLPKKISERTTKSPYLPDYQVRFNKQRSKAISFIHEIQHHALVKEVIDLPRLLFYLTQSHTANSTKIDHNFLNYHLIPQAVYLAAFLSSFS